MTKRSYMEAVKAGLDSAVPVAPIHVRFIPSIDRRETTEAAIDTVSPFSLVKCMLCSYPEIRGSGSIPLKKKDLRSSWDHYAIHT